MDLRKRIAISIAQFLLQEEPASEKPVDLYMKWKTKYNIRLRHPDTAKYALRKFAELGNLTEKERRAFAEAIRIELTYAAKEEQQKGAFTNDRKQGENREKRKSSK